MTASQCSQSVQTWPNHWLLSPVHRVPVSRRRSTVTNHCLIDSTDHTPTSQYTGKCPKPPTGLHLILKLPIVTQYSVSQTKYPTAVIWHFSFSHKQLKIFDRFLHTYYTFLWLQIFIQLSLTLTKLCHIKRDYPVHIICAKCPKRAHSDVCVSRW